MKENIILIFKLYEFKILKFIKILDINRYIKFYVLQHMFKSFNF